MMDQVLQLLAQTLQSDARTRTAAEARLEALHADEQLPEALVAIARHKSAPLEHRQAALLILKKVVQKAWSPGLDEYEGPYTIPDHVRSSVRSAVLAIATGPSEETKIVAAASYVVSKIATVDYPEQWPELLPRLLAMMPSAEPQQLHSVLVVLSDLVDEGFDEEQFAGSAVKLVSAIHAVAIDSTNPLLTRALSVSVFRSCLDTMEVVLQTEGEAVQQFVQEAAILWVPFFLQVITNSGSIALEIQAVKALDKLHTIFPQSLAAQTIDIFEAIVSALETHLPTFHQLYTGDEQKEVQAENSDRLPTSLEMLVLEQLDYLQTLLNLNVMKSRLAPVMGRLVDLVVSYAYVSAEDLSMWDLDVNAFVAEEATATAQYSPRNASAEVAIKLSRSFLHEVKTSPYDTWKKTEACLYLVKSVLEDLRSAEKEVEAALLERFSKLSHHAMTSEIDLLRARGFVTAAYSIGVNPEAFVNQAIRAISNTSYPLCQVSAMKAVQLCAKRVPNEVVQGFQNEAVTAISAYLSSQDVADLDEDHLATLVATLKDVMDTDASLCLTHSGLDVLLTLASYGAKSWHVTDLATEAFEAAVIAVPQYAAFSARILPSLTTALEAEGQLSDVAAALLAVLAEHGPSPLPSGFVAAVVPKLFRILLLDLDFSVHQSATVTLKHILRRDPQQLFEWTDPESHKGGLEVVLTVIDRLLGPTVQESSAAEVGGLAVELVEKAGADRLGPFLLQLLTVVAIRLGTAERADLVQDLVLVFARLALSNAKDVLDFLSQVVIEEAKTTGLELVMQKWLDNSINFSGYEAIRQNVVALTNIFRLHDPRLTNIQTKGDLIVDNSSRIKTRSLARTRPDQYHVISVPLKLIKVLVQEMIIAPGETAKMPSMGKGESDEDDWEDEAPIMDLGSASTRQDLMSFMDSMHEFKVHQADDATQQYLVDFFKSLAGDESFRQLYGGLNAAEQEKLAHLG